MKYILAFDAGTTSVRAIVFDQEGRIQAAAQKEIRQIFPKPGWVEQDPQEIWFTQMSVAVEALGRARIRPDDIAGIGITNQRETTIVWDRKTGEAVYHAIVWQDRRTAEACDQLRAAGHDKIINERTGLLLDSYFSGTKIAWILDHVPGVRARAEAGDLLFGTVDTWLIWKLTSGQHVHVTDPSNASRTLLYNIHAGRWDEPLLKLLRIPASLLPEVRTSSEVYGEVSTSLGLQKVLIAGIAGDQQSALFGQMCVNRGQAKNTYGTGCFLLQNLGSKPITSRNRLLISAACQIGQKREFALEGSVFIGGAVVQWLRDGLRLVRSADEVNLLANSTPNNGGVYLVPAFAGLGAPHWDPYARGAIIGITRDTSAAHIARAALEGIAFQVADLIDAMHNDT
jgi:glycerol kinase